MSPSPVPRSNDACTSQATENSDVNNASGCFSQATSRVEQVRRQRGVGYVGLNVSAENLEKGKETHDPRAIVWFDIDNTLYHKSTRIAQLMKERIHAYFLGLGLPEIEAKALHSRYYRDHGLAIRGLLKHHDDVDPLDYDRRVDGSLPLDDLLKPEAELTALLRDLDRTKCRVFALTNAYKSHAMRCIRLLGLQDFFDGILYCDYAAGPLFCCKPDVSYYEAAAEIVGATDPSKFYFVDDSEKNIRAAKEMGWCSAVFYNEAEPEADHATSFNGTRQSQEQKDATAAINGGGLMPNANTLCLDERAIKRQVQSLSTAQRLRMFEILLACALPSEEVSMQKAWKYHFSSAQDFVSRMPESLCAAIFERLSIRELLQCGLVSKRWLHIASQPNLWRSHALALTESDAEPLGSPVDESGWKVLVKSLHMRERNWCSGLAQSIQFLQGHTGYVTSMKLRGTNNLVTGSYDGSIRIWDLSGPQGPICKREIKAEKIACLDFVMTGRGEGVIAAGLYDIGRTLIFDLRTGELMHTLAGHNKGIRHLAMNDSFVVSTGQDKAICVWNHNTGERVVRFGQQTNVSLGVCLVDTDKLVAVTIDGIIRSFSVRAKKMIGEFDITKLGGKRGEYCAVLKEMTSDGATLSWFAAEGSSVTVASKSLVVHLKWREHVVPIRQRRDSVESSYSASPLPRAESKAGSASSASRASTPARRDGSGELPGANGGKQGSGSATGATPAARSSAPPQSPAATRTILVPTTPAHPRTAKTPVSAVPLTPSGGSHTKGMTTPLRDPSSPSMSTTLAQDHKLVVAQSDRELPMAAAATRVAPNLKEAPRLVSVVRTPEVAVGAVDPRKRRMVCASRFSSRVGAERKLYTSTFTDESVAIATVISVQPGVSSGSEVNAILQLASIGGAWDAQSQQLATPDRNPMVVVLDHESVVVGCSDGLVYRIGFVGESYKSVAVEQPIISEVGDATITDLIQLRGLEGWKDLFLPEGTPDDHPARVDANLAEKVGLC